MKLWDVSILLVVYFNIHDEEIILIVRKVEETKKNAGLTLESGCIFYFHIKFSIWIPCCAFVYLLRWNVAAKKQEPDWKWTPTAPSQVWLRLKPGNPSHLTAIEFFRKCLLVILISSLGAKRLCSSSVWVSWFFVSTLLWPARVAPLSFSISAWLFSSGSAILPSDELSRPLRSASIQPLQSGRGVGDAGCVAASLNPHFPPSGIWGHINESLLGYAHSHSDSSIRAHGSRRPADWF